MPNVCCAGGQRAPTQRQTGTLHINRISPETNLALWDKLFASRPWHPPEELVRFIARNFGSVPDREAVRVLEVGCGTGANLWYAAKEGFTIAGIDGSRLRSTRSTSRLREEGLLENTEPRN